MSLPVPALSDPSARKTHTTSALRVITDDTPLTAMEYHGLSFSFTPSWTAIVLGVTIFVISLYRGQNNGRPHAAIPVLSTDRNEYLQNGRALLERGKKYPSCFQVRTGTNWKIVLPNRFAHELKNHPDLSFNDAHARDSFTSYPGLQPFREILENDTFIQEVVRKKLTQSLGLITAGMYTDCFNVHPILIHVLSAECAADLRLPDPGLVEETQLTFRDIFGGGKEWQTRVIKSDVQDIIARTAHAHTISHPSPLTFSRRSLFSSLPWT